jgi:uridine phosphorylase
MERRAFHLGLTASMIDDIDLVLLPGDPQRVPKIGQYLKQPRTLAEVREFHSLRGQYEDKNILVTSTGIGGPSTAIVIEELALLGMKNFLRIGTTGAIQPHIAPGDLIIPSGAVRLDGASRHIAPIEYPAVAHFSLVSALHQAAATSQQKVYSGVIASSDTFYQGQSRHDTFLEGFTIRTMRDQLSEMQHLGVLSFEMEAATVLTQTSCYGLRGACILGVLVNRHQQEIPDPEIMRQTEQNVIQTAISSLGYL